MPSERALALQAELQQLKATYKQLRMRKAPPGSSIEAPFPISLDAVIPAPNGTRIDVEQLTLHFLIRLEVLQEPPSGTAVSLSVSGEPPLPDPLAAEIAAQLHAAWAAAAGAALEGTQQQQAARPHFGLGTVLQAAQRQYSQLVGCMPQYLEPYEGVDEVGATVRRFALVSSQEAPQPAAADAAAAASTPAAAPAASVVVAAAQAGVPQADGQQSPMHMMAPAAAPSKQPAASPSSPHAAPLASTAGRGGGSAAATPAASHASASSSSAAAGAGKAPGSSRAAQGAAGGGALRRPIAFRPPVLPHSRRPQLPAASGGDPGAGSFDRDLQWLVTKFGSAMRLGGGGDEGRDGELPRGQEQQQQQQLEGHLIARGPPPRLPHGQQQPQGEQQEQEPEQQHYHHHHHPTDLQQQQQHQQQQSLIQQHSSFSLMLRPTDPSWGQRGRIQVTGTWDLQPPTSKPPGSSFQYASCLPGGLQLRVLPTIGVPAADAARLQVAVQQQADAAARSRSAPLRTALKWLESYAGTVLEDGNTGSVTQAPAAGRSGASGDAARLQQWPGGEEAARGQRWPGGEEAARGQGSSMKADGGEGGHSGGRSSSSGGSEGTFGSSAESRGESEDGSESFEDSEDEGDCRDEEDEGPSAAAGAGGSAQHSGGGGSGSGSAYGITLEGLQLDLIDALEILEAHLQLSCRRCAAPAAATLAPDAGAGGAAARAWEWRGACGKCAQQMWAMMRPKIVHEMNNEVAALKTEGCRPLDLLPSLFGAQCGDCSASVALRGVQIGLPSSRSCTHCHEQLNLIVPAVAFIPKRPPDLSSRQRSSRADGGGSGARGAGGGGSARGGQPQVVLGQPLPFLGTCKHYRHSHRWLRFPCCGQRFPCDICHEEGTDGHEVAWAKRMTCGYCSAEQALADSCSACGKKLASSASNPSGRSTRFWEGGQGCRDSNAMSRRDPRRYRDRNKTKSAKHKRVGPKPWS